MALKNLDGSVIIYPTELHRKAASEITDFFSRIQMVGAVLLTCSCARGKATKDSCLDLAVLLSPSLTDSQKDEIISRWNSEHNDNPLYKELKGAGRYSHIDLDFIDGNFEEGDHEWTSGPDQFELQIGNFIAYAVPLYKNGEHFDLLKSTWLPYYDEARRTRRLEMVKKFCLNNLQHIPGYIERQLYFQAFRRLYNATGEFLQALFIADRTYPVAYDKWIKEQLTEILDYPRVYDELVKIMEYGNFESSEHIEKAARIEFLLNQYC